MNPSSFSCMMDDREEWAVRYVRGALSAAEVDAFELHLLSCAHCQSAVREAAELRSAFRRRARNRRAVQAAATLTAAAVLAAVWLTPSPTERLGRVASGPTVRAMPVRSPADSVTRWAALGLEAYQRGAHAEAAAWLARAYAQDRQPGAGFVLGAALLMDQRPDSAIGVFQRVAASGSNPYVGESLYYSAKAWLQLGRADSASALLARAAAQGTTAQRVQARALLDSLERLK
jgi:FimV-like protein